MNLIAIYQNGIHRCNYASKTISEIVRMIKYYGYIGIKGDANYIEIKPGDKITGRIVRKI